MVDRVVNCDSWHKDTTADWGYLDYRETSNQGPRPFELCEMSWSGGRGISGKRGKSRQAENW